MAAENSSIYAIFLQNDKTGEVVIKSATRFRYITSLDFRHWAYHHHTIIGRAAGKVAEFFDFHSPPEVLSNLSSQGYSTRPVDTSPLNPDDKLAELLYVSLAQDSDIQHPITNALILSTDNLLLLVVKLGYVQTRSPLRRHLADDLQDPVAPDGTLPYTFTVNEATYPIIGQIRDGEPSFNVAVEELDKYLQSDNVIYHRCTDLVKRDVKEARAVERAERKAAKRRAQKEKKKSRAS